MKAKVSNLTVLGWMLGGALLLCSPLRSVVAEEAPSADLATRYIVQAANLKAAIRAVKAVGGTMTHKLAIIDAVSAELTPTQYASLESSPDVKRIYGDREVRLSSVQTVRDEFTTVSYGNNDGSSVWMTDWQEIGEADGPSSGFVKVQDNFTCTSGRCLYFDVYGVSGGTGAMREVDLSSASSATLSFVWGTYYYNFGAQIDLEVSADGGGSWTSLATYSVDQDRFDQNASFDLMPWASSNTRIRFRVAVADTGDFGVDNLEIVYNNTGDSSDGGGSSSVTETVSDELATVSFAGNDGSKEFLAPWQEIGESNGVGSGYARVLSSSRCVTGYCLRLGANLEDGGYVGDRGVERAADLTGADRATLSFDYFRRGSSSGSVAARVEVSGDGGASWTHLQTYALSFYDSAPQRAIFALEKHTTLGADTRVRVVISGSYPEESGRFFYVDDLEISYSSSGGGPSAPVTGTISSRVSFSEDDVEEKVSTGRIYSDSSDLELSYDSGYLGSQRVGMRFRDLAIPRGATITSARIAFETDETDSGSAALLLRAQAIDDAPAFSSVDFDLSSRSTTTAEVTWNPPSWPTLGEKRQTPDLSTLVQEVVDRPGWQSGNSLVFVVSGSGERAAESYDGEPAAAPLLTVTYTSPPDTQVPSLVGADELHALGIDGSGVTVAVIDTGYWSHPGLDTNSNGISRVLALFDAIANMLTALGIDTDFSGHGTHVSSLLLSSTVTANGKYNGIAPGADLVSIKAFAGDGSGSYSDVIRAIEFAVTYKDSYGIRVLNLSFSAEATTTIPACQAVITAWFRGSSQYQESGSAENDRLSTRIP